jgi:hypothetical protein
MNHNSGLPIVLQSYYYDTCTCMYRNCHSPYIVAVDNVLLSEIDNNEEGIKEVFDKSLWKANDIVQMPSIKFYCWRQIVCCSVTLSLLLSMFLSNWQLAGSTTMAYFSVFPNCVVIWVCMFILRVLDLFFSR